MAEPTPYAGVANGEYHPPVPIQIPPLWAWPPRPVATVRWFIGSLLYPWVGLYLILSVVIWRWLLPSEESMATLRLGWILQIWIRNLALLTLVAGGLHLLLYQILFPLLIKQKFLKVLLHFLLVIIVIRHLIHLPLQLLAKD